jgi:hypothetical protein
VRFGPSPAANRGVVRIGDGRHYAFHLLVDSVALPLGKDRHVARGKIARVESVKHDYNDALGRSCLALRHCKFAECRRRGGDSAILKHAAAARKFVHGYLHFAIAILISGLPGNIHPAQAKFNPGFRSAGILPAGFRPS